MVLATTLWLLKILRMKTIATSFTKGRYYDDIKTVLSTQFVIRCLFALHPCVMQIMEGAKMVVGNYTKFKGQK